MKIILWNKTLYFICITQKLVHMAPSSQTSHMGSEVYFFKNNMEWCFEHPTYVRKTFSKLKSNIIKDLVQDHVSYRIKNDFLFYIVYIKVVKANQTIYMVYIEVVRHIKQWILRIFIKIQNLILLKTFLNELRTIERVY